MKKYPLPSKTASDLLCAMRDLMEARRSENTSVIIDPEKKIKVVYDVETNAFSVFFEDVKNILVLLNKEVVISELNQDMTNQLLSYLIEKIQEETVQAKNDRTSNEMLQAVAHLVKSAS